MESGLTARVVAGDLRGEWKVEMDEIDPKRKDNDYLRFSRHAPWWLENYPMSVEITLHDLKYHKVCGKCGSDNVYIKRLLYWNFEAQEWQGEPFNDEHECADCASSNIEILDVAAADQG